MKMWKVASNFLTVALLVLAFTSVASAQATRTWVSGVGDDANPCSRTAPCKTFAGAISKTANGGEIDCLDPGGFGALTITKSITIDCDSGVGSILVAGTNGIVIAATAGTDNIYIKNLNFNGLGPVSGTNAGANGIRVLSAKAVHLQELDIFGFQNNGVDVNTGATNVVVTLEDVHISECGFAAGTFGGLNVNSSNGNTAFVDVHNSRFDNLPNGISAQNGSRIVIRNCNISGGSPAFNANGVLQNNLSSGGSVVTISESTVAFWNTAALTSAPGGAAFIAAYANTFENNALIFNTAGGSITSGGDNIAFGNGATGSSTVGGKV